MSPFRPKTRLSVTALEDRTTPAVTASMMGGALVLTGDNTANEVTVTVGTGNQVTLTVNGNAAGTFTPSTGLFATFGSANDKFHLNLNGNTLTVANVVVRGGDGNDSMDVVGGLLQSNLWLLGGNGDDSFSSGGATVTGSTIVIDGGAGNDTLSSASRFSAATWITGVQNVGLGGAQVNGNLVALATEALPASFGLTSTTVNGSVWYFGTSAADQVNLGGGTGISGSLIAVLGDGDNTFNMDPSAAAGRTQVFGGSGNDTFSFGNTATTKDLDLVLGNGTNSVTSGGLVVNGNLRIWGGSGADTVNLGTYTVVNGNLGVYLGDGANTYTGPPNRVGGTFTYIGGSGVDTVSITGGRGNGYPIVMRLGAGDDSFTYTHVNGTSIDPTSWDIDFGSGHNTFSSNVPVTWPSKMVGL